MNTKKILSLVVALAMIVAVVPAFGLVAGAAETTDVISTIDGAEILWSAPDNGGLNDADIANYWAGWSASGNYANLKTYDGYGDTLQIYSAGSKDCSAVVTSPGYGKGAKTLIIEFLFKGITSSDCYYDLTLKDVNDTAITTFTVDKNYPDVTDTYPIGYPDGKKVALVVTNNDDGATHTVEYYVEGESVKTLTYDGVVSGFKSIEGSSGYWSNWTHVGFVNLTIGAVMPETVVVNGVTYTVVGEVLTADEGTTLSTWTRASDGAALQNWEVVGDESFASGTAIHLNGTVQGGNAENTMRTFFPVTGGKTYYVTYTEHNTTSGSSGSMRAAVATGEAKFGAVSFDVYSPVDYGGVCSWTPADVTNGGGTPYGTAWTREQDSESNASGAVVSHEYIINVPEGAENIMLSLGAWGNTGVNYGDFAIYEIELADVEVTATYTVNGEPVAEESAYYNASEAENVTFAEKYYGADGENVLYYAGETALSASGEIEMTALENGGLAVGTTVEANDKVYQTTSANLIPNGDFAYGLNGWLDGTGVTPTTFTVNGDGTVTSTSNGGNAGTGCLYRSWAIEAGKTYAFVYDEANASGDGNYRVFSLADTLGDAETKILNYATAAGDGQAVVFTNEFTGIDENEAEYTYSYAYAKLRYRWNGTDTFGNFGLYEVEEVEGTSVTVTYKTEDGETVKTVTKTVAEGESLEVAEQEVFTLDGTFYLCPAQTVSENTEITVYPVENKYGVLEDALVSDNEIWGVGATNDNSVFVAAGDDVNRAPLSDADGVAVTDGTHTPSVLGKSRVGFMEFPVVDLAEGQLATLNCYVRTWHDNTFSNNNTSIRLAAYVLDDSSWATLADGQSYDSANAPLLESYAEPIFSEANYRTEVLTFDVTEAMKAAKAAGLEKFDVRLNSAWGAAYIAEREAAVLGGDYEGKAAYILVEDGGVSVESDASYITVNGSKVGTSATVPSGSYVVAYDAEGNAVPVIVNGTAYVENGRVENITEATTLKVAAKAVAPTVSAELGWDSANNRFAIDFVTEGADFATGYIYGVDFYANPDTTAFASSEITEAAPNAGISTVNTNLTYAAQPWVKITEDSEKILGTAVYSSVYKVLTENILGAGYTAETGFNAARTALAVEVINNGGLFVTESGTLTDELLNIVVYDEASDSYTLSDIAKAMGITFNGQYDTITIENGEAVLSNSEVATLSAESVFELEDVELVIVPELVEESVIVEQVETELTFEEIL